MWFEALKSFYFNSRVPGRPCHCYLKSAIFDPLCPREKDGRGQSGPKSCFPVNIEVIRGDKEFPRWFQAPCLTLPLWPDFDLKISHFWSPRAQTGRVAGVKAALYHVFPLIEMWFETFKSFHVDSRVPGWPCHCYLILTSKSAIFDPPVHTREGWQGPKRP